MRASSKRAKPTDPGIGNTPWWHWLILLPVLTAWPWYLVKLHYLLPEPLPPTDGSGRPQPSEEIVLRHITALEQIGYRTVGTEEAKRGEEYVLEQVREIQQRCTGVIHCEVSVQQGSGYHQFDILHHEVLKVYSGITNIILQLTTPGRNSSNALLLGSHIDSTLPSPGAADDGMGVGVMLDVARVIVDRDEPFDNALIFMWNGGEETLQDGSHLYSTQHPSAKSVKAVINLEAAGTTGGALLFQATSAEMIEAWSKAPHAKGTVVAADVFSSGVILSDTDFGQFEQYLGVSGLDMAIVGHSYFYHTRSDSAQFIEPGCSQHFTSNILPIVDHLLKADSAIASGTFSPPDVVYLSLLDRVFLSWSMNSGARVYLAMAAVVLAVVVRNVKWDKGMAVALFGTPIGLVAGVGAANAVAGVMILLGRRQAWFPHEHLPLLIFAPPAYLGHLTLQYLLARLLTPAQRTRLEQNHYYAQLLFATFYMLLLQAYNIRSAYMFGATVSFLLFGLVGKGLWAYLLPTGAFVLVAVEAITLTLDIFTPLTGRMGKDAPHDIIMASLASLLSFLMAPPIVPLFHRLPRRIQRYCLYALAALTAAVMLVLGGPWWIPYDRMHPKRVGLQYHFNHTSGLSTAHVAFMDMAHNRHVVQTIHDRYGAGPLHETQLTEYDSDWDILYPLPSFLDTWNFALSPSQFAWPALDYQATELSNVDGVRKIKMRFDFTGLVWPVLAFEAEVVSWSFDFAPPTKRKRHHLKVVASIDQPEVDFELEVKDDGKPLSIHYSAIDLNQMVPGTAARRGPDMPASKWLMEVDEWAAERWNGAMDFVMTGTVAGVVEV